MPDPKTKYNKCHCAIASVHKAYSKNSFQIARNKTYLKDMQVTNYTCSNHWLESAGLNALEEVLFKMLGIDREDRNACFVCK